jgi:hypothetical protein
MVAPRIAQATAVQRKMKTIAEMRLIMDVLLGPDPLLGKNVSGSNI